MIRQVFHLFCWYFDGDVIGTKIKLERVRKALELNNTKFKRFFGVKKATFGRMLEILYRTLAELHKQGGKPFAKLQVEDKTILTLQYGRAVGFGWSTNPDEGTPRVGILRLGTPKAKYRTKIIGTVR